MKTRIPFETADFYADAVLYTFDEIGLNFERCFERAYATYTRFRQNVMNTLTTHFNLEAHEIVIVTKGHDRMKAEYAHWSTHRPSWTAYADRLLDARRSAPQRPHDLSPQHDTSFRYIDEADIPALLAERREYEAAEKAYREGQLHLKASQDRILRELAAHWGELYLSDEQRHRAWDLIGQALLAHLSTHPTVPKSLDELCWQFRDAARAPGLTKG